MIIWEGDPADPTRKPPEMYTLIENFCLGLRRLEVFGRPSSLRRGWVTVLAPGQESHLETLSLSEDGTPQTVRAPCFDSLGGTEKEEWGQATLWNKESWEEGIKELANGGKAVVPMTPEIDALRPKSPVRGGSAAAAGVGGPQGHVGMPQQGGGGPRFNQGVMPMQGGPRMGGGPGFMSLPNNPMMAANQMVGVQPGMMGMGMPLMANAAATGMGMEEMMAAMGGAWNPAMGMGGMNPNVGMGAGVGMQGMMPPVGMGGMMPGQGMPGATGHGNPQVAMMGQMGGQMGQMGMGQGGFNAGMPGMFNPAAMGNWNNDQGQFAMDTSGWEGDQNSMNGMGMAPGMMGGMGGMNMMGQWAGGGGVGGMNSRPAGNRF